jgi:hypothetical protein
MLFFPCACGSWHGAEEVAEFEREYGSREPVPFTRAEMADFRAKLTRAMQDTAAPAEARSASAKFLDLCDLIEKHGMVQP